ncbi:MAG TPA: hypothetical protein VFL97_01600 [Nitrococcus sp.]|nr:hypothetical protein [Nitrococcus sp.]
MKKAIVSAVIGASVFAGSVMAQTVFYAPNDDGGIIGFTDQGCGDGLSYIAYGTTRSGPGLVGCYTVDWSMDTMLVQWSQIGFYTYPISRLTFNPNYRQPVKANRSKR